MRKKMFFLYLGSFIASILPVTVFMVFRWNDYVVSVPAGGFRLTIGGIIAGFILILRILGKLKVPSAFITSLFLSLFCWAVQPILKDLTIIFALIALGEGVDVIFFRSAIKKARKEKESDELAQKIASELEKAGVKQS